MIKWEAKRKMKKIIVIGCPGSGKSTFARALHGCTQIPLYYLDMMFWNADKTTVDRQTFLDRLSAVLEGDEWIIDGNYSSTMELRLSACDTVFFLDYPTDVCIDGVNKRRGVPRPDMPWVEFEEDSEFAEYIRRFNNTEKPRILALFDRYKDKIIIVFTSRQEAETYLAEELSNK